MTQFTRFPPPGDVTITGPVDVITTPGGFTNISPGFPTQVPIGTTSTQLFAANPMAIYRHISNNSQAEIFVQYGASAAPNQGIEVAPRGVLFVTGADLYKGIINAIGLINTQLIDILEGTN